MIIIGAGIVGLATALALRKLGRRALVLEAESTLGAHQTGHNSGVIHSGIYYKPGSQKAETCRLGREALYYFCAENNIPCRQTGKLIIATSRDQVPLLDLLYDRGVSNGLKGIRHISIDQLRELEPEAAGIAALHVPQTGIVDYLSVLHVLRKSLEAQGSEVHLEERVVGIRMASDHIEVVTNKCIYKENFLINCGGLQSDRIAVMCGIRPPVQIVPFKGEYYLLREESAALVRNPIYPVPDPNLPFLGVHFTPRIDGRVEAGPNAVLSWSRHGYNSFALSPRDAWDTLTWSGFWPMAAKHWRNAVSEQIRSWNKSQFVRSLQELVPAVRDEDVIPSGSGIRAQAVDRHGGLVDDFLFKSGSRSLHVLNAPSPAATACLEIGRRIADAAFSHPDYS